MLIEIKSVNVNNNDVVEFNIKGDRNRGYKVQEANGRYVNPRLAIMDFDNYSEIIDEVLKAGTSILWLEPSESCYMATKEYHITCTAKED